MCKNLCNNCKYCTILRQGPNYNDIKVCHYPGEYAHINIVIRCKHRQQKEVK